MFPEFRATPEGFVAGGAARVTNAQQAKATVVEHGTPVRLLQLLFIGLGVRLVIYNGNTCKYVNVPDNWESFPERKRKTVILNVWGNHVFTYSTGHAILRLTRRTTSRLVRRRQWKWRAGNCSSVRNNLTGTR